MPLVHLAPADRAAREASAAASWAALRAIRPDLEPAVALQEELIGLVLNLAETLGAVPAAAPVASPEVSGREACARRPCAHGRADSAADGDPEANLAEAVPCACPGRRRRSGRAHRVSRQRGTPRSRIAARRLARARSALDSHRREHRGLAPDLLWLVAELAVSPYVHALAQSLLSSTDAALAGALAAWNRGYCPACGSWPALAEVADSHRILRCSFCAAAWELNRYACVYCDEGGEPFVTAAPDENRKDRRLELCSACGGYLKTVDVSALARSHSSRSPTWKRWISILRRWSAASNGRRQRNSRQKNSGAWR